MRFYAKVVSVLFFWYSVYVFIPFLWVFDLFVMRGTLIFNKIEIIEQVNSLWVTLLLPLGIVYILFMFYPIYYIMELVLDLDKVLQKISFSHTKARVHFANSEFFYKHLFMLLEESLQDISTEPPKLNDAITYYRGDELRVWFYDSRLKRTVNYKLLEDSVLLCVGKEPHDVFESIEIAQHDREIYRHYHEAILDLYMAMAAVKREKEKVNVKEITAQVQPVQKKPLVETFFSAIKQMKRENCSQESLIIDGVCYVIRLHNQLIEIANEKEVIIKCAVVANRPIVYIHPKFKNPKAHQQITDFYATFLSKTKQLTS